MNRLLSILFLISSFYAFAQTGEVSGVVLDANYNDQPLPFADVYLKGTTNGASTDFDGKFTLSNVPSGQQTIIITFIGYETKTETVQVVAGQTTTLNVTLSGDLLDEVVVVATPKIKETEQAIVKEQKEAVVITQKIGSEELAKKGVSNAEAAVTKVAGVTKSQGSKNVFVRGLGDRYNSSSLNGLPLPSDDPESKNISLDYFSSNVISNIGINKTFSPSIYGDVGGANIDIASKVVTKNSLSISSSVGFNSQTVGSDFLRIEGANNFGTGVNEVNPITDRNLGTYNFENALQPVNSNFPLNTSISLVAGGKINIGSNKLSAFFVGSNKSSYRFKEGINGSITADGRLSRRQNFEKYDFNVTQLAMGGLNYTYGGNNSISLTHLYIHNNTQSVGEYIGLDTGVNDNGNTVFTRRQQLNDNDLFVNQLTGNQEITDRLNLDYGGSFSFIAANEPDRKTNTFFQNDAGDIVPAQGTAAFNHRFFSELQEDDFAGKAIVSYNLNHDVDDEFIREVKGGYNFRYTKRNFIFRQFNANIIRQGTSNINNVDATFNQENLDNGNFTLVTDRGTQVDSNGRQVSPLFPFFYLGDRTTHSGFAEGIYQFNEKLTLNGGIRYDNIDQSVDYDTALVSSVNGANRDETARLSKEYILPSVNIKYNIDENTIVRLAGSLSYTLPQLREVAPFVYEGINFTTIGNPSIDASESYNLDLKGEYYFGENKSNLITATAFYKYIDFPINRVGSNSAANQITFVNVPEATVLGLEVEFKADVMNIDDEQFLSIGFNGAYLYSQQTQEDIDSDDVTIRFTNNKDQLQGASPILLNGDVTYKIEKENLSFSTSLVGNYFSKRIFALGVAGSENIEESSIIGIDFVNRLKLNKKLGINLSIKNIINPKIELTQEANGEDQILNSFRRGQDISLGLSYKF